VIVLGTGKECEQAVTCVILPTGKEYEVKEKLRRCVCIYVFLHFRKKAW